MHTAVIKLDNRLFPSYNGKKDKCIRLFLKNFDFEFNVLFWHVFLLRSALCAHAKAAVVKLDAFSKLESVHSRLTGSIVVRDSSKTEW